MKMVLNRSITLPQAVFYGVGVIIGAGIYTLIGSAAGIAGGALWISFVIAGVIASLTALTYSELTKRFSKEAAETVFILHAFNNKTLGFVIGYLSLITILISIGTVAWGFATYFKLFIDINPHIVTALLIAGITIINLYGVQKSTLLNIVMTLITVLGLLIVIIFGLPYVGSTNLFVGLNGETLTENSFSFAQSLFSAAALIFFAFLGFEEIANISEETKNPKKNVPKAILLSLLIASALYILISIVAVSVISPAQLAEAADPNSPLTQGPLALVVEKAVGAGYGYWFSFFALCATASTILVSLTVSSRILYGLSKQGMLPKIFQKTNTEQVPFFSILFVGIATIILAWLGNLTLLGYLTTVGTFLLFFAVNVSLIAINYEEHTLNLKNKIKKGFFSTYYLPAILGALFCITMFFTQYWQPIEVFGFKVPLLLLSLIIFSTAIPIYWVMGKKNPQRE